MHRRETERLLVAIRQAQTASERVALATVVRVKGSAYRREGTRVIVRQNGTYECALSGGCLEPSVAEAETSDSDLEEAAPLASSAYSPLAAAATDAPDLTGAGSAWRDAARALVRRLDVGLSRRWRPAPHGRRFDLRRTLRASLQTGGEALTPRWLRAPGALRDSCCWSTAAAR